MLQWASYSTLMNRPGWRCTRDAEGHDLSEQEPALVTGLMEAMKQADFMQEYLGYRMV